MTHNYSIKKNGIPGNRFGNPWNYLDEIRSILIVTELLKKKWFSLALVLLAFTFSGFSQKQKDVLPYACVKYVGNGLYQASFGYENPTKKEILLDEEASFIKSNNGKRVAKGLNRFKPGSVKNVFTKEFGSKDYVEWVIISNGNIHSVIVNANSGVCEYNNGFIFPLYGQNNGKYENSVGPELAALSEGAAGDQPSDLIFQINDEKVLIEIVPEAGQMASVLSLLQNIYSLTYDGQNPENSDFLLDPQEYLLLSAVDVYFPIDKLADLNEIQDVNFVRPLYPAVNESVPVGFTGNSVSQGDETQNSNIVREAYRLIQDGDLNPVDGSGIKIGVISNSFDTQPYTEGISKATVDVKQGDLPGALNEHGYTVDVDNRQEWDYGTATDEGRAMMHIIHDVAPGASLAFYSGSLSPRNFELGFKELADCDIIVDDITFITEPFFGEGRMSALIKEFTAEGKLHFTSAGNFGNKGYQGVFNATDQIPVTNFLNGSLARAHVFDSSSGDYLQKISVKEGETYMLVLQWVDQLSASQNNEIGATVDLDFFIVDDSGRLLVGNNRDNKAGDAAEVMVFSATADGEANIMITSASGEGNIPFRYIAFKSNGLELLEYNEGIPTISGHAMTEESVTVGAIRFNKDEAEAFSSYGGILSDGTTLNVDMGAPDGVNTNVGSIGIHKYADGSPIDGDPFPNFFGTSAAAPSAAAAMALLQSALPVWYPDGNGGSTISSSQAVQLFKENSKGSSQPLQVSNGMIDVSKVFESLASQTARITSFTIVENQDGSTPIPSAEPIEIKLIGEFFPPAPPEGETYETYPIVYFNEEPIDYTVNEDGTILAYVPVFSGNPDLQIFTAAKPGSVNNGGLSDPIKILPQGQSAINISVDDLVIKYGQDYLSRLSYTVEGIPEEGFPDGQSFENYFPEIVYNSTADDFSYPDVNNYLVEASFGVESLTEDQMEKYQVNFVNKGNLSVVKNNLNIKPLNQNLTYGDIVQNSLTYQITDEQGNEISNDSDLYADLDDFYATISQAHASDFYFDSYDQNNPESIMLLINGFNSESQHYSAVIDLLEDGGWVSTENAILNGVIRQRGIMNDMRQSAVLNEFRQTNIMNDFRQSALMNTLRIDQSYFTDYIDGSIVNDVRQQAIMNDEWVSRTSNIMNDLRQAGVMNDFRQTAVMNDMRVGAIMNIIDIVDLKVDAIVNGEISRQLGVMNDLRQSAVMNGLRQSAIMNETGQNAVINDKIFSLIDYTDVPTENDLNREIQRFYAVNLLSGIDVTGETSTHYLFPGAFLNNMAANFNIHYDQANIGIQKAELLVNTVDFEVSYGTVMSDKDIPTTFSKTANYEVIEAIFPDGIPYYFTKEGDATEYTLDGDIKMDVGVYDVFIRDIAENYSVKYDSAHGKLTVNEAVLMVDTTIAEAIKYGEIPIIDVTFTGFAEGEDVSSVFPESEGGIPFFFMKADDPIIYTIEGDQKMSAGVYDIFVTDHQQDNYLLEFADDRGELVVSEAELSFVPIDMEINYGDLPTIDPLFEGFAYDESANVLEDEFGLLPYYFVKEGDMTIYTIGGAEKMGVGVYVVYITDNTSDNYEIESPNGLGLLKVAPKIVNTRTSNLIRTYGDQILKTDLNTIFDSFAYDETVTEVFGEAGIPYYFIKEGDPVQYNPDGNDKMSIGDYKIIIEDEALMNYILELDETANNLTIQRKELTASIEDVVINQGEFPDLVDKTHFNGFAYNETAATVFRDGISYYFVDESNIEFSVDEPGVYSIRIVAPENYMIVYANEAKLWINPFHDDIRKIRIYSDCVSYNEGGADGLNYKVIFRYENDNDYPVFVFEGDKNYLSGTAFEGTLQTSFLPGSGTFEIQFDGNRLTWSLETYGSVNKTSVSSSNNDGTGECEAKIDNTYLIYPNPVTEILNIEQQESEVSEVFILNMFGVILASDAFDGAQPSIEVDMTSYKSGMYIVRIVSSNKVNSYNVLKE